MVIKASITILSSASITLICRIYRSKSTKRQS
nr:MAG TPA: hypothetical protein [Caudoviricetes sp.]DAZ01856.1 MAG TPA: hypothetical protein [Caudoviricetes sp.]